MGDKIASGKIITELIIADGREITQIANDLGISKSRLSQYKNGHRFPNAEFIQSWKSVFDQDLMELISMSDKNPSNHKYSVVPADLHREYITDLKQAKDETISVLTQEVLTLKETISDLRNDKQELLKRIPVSS